MASSFDVELPAGALEAARQGQASGLEAIYRTFERAVYTLARRISGDPDSASDIAHDTFLRAFAKLGQFRGEAPFGRWLRAITANEALMHLRGGRRFLDLHEDVVADVPGPNLTQFGDSDLEEALALLAPLPRAVLWLYHVEGYTHAEIARLSGRSTSFSKSQLSRAHQRLRQLLEHGRVDVGTNDAPSPARAMTQTYGAI